ncbi:MAG: hypothetical protein WDW36_001392 [Sanguina aurantia]
MEPNTAYSHGECEAWKDPAHCSGGIARMKAFLDQERAVHPSAIVLNAGDDNHGTVWDGQVLGNWDLEFARSADKTAEYVKALTHPVLGACNIDFHGHWLGGLVKRYTTKQVDGLKVCIFGLVTWQTHTERCPPLQIINPPYESGRKCVADMKKDGCQVIILLSHLGYSADLQAAKLIPDVDLIVGGHSHSYLSPDGKAPVFDKDGDQRDYIWGPYPTWVQSDVQQGRKVPVVQAGWGSRYMGRIRLTLGSDGHLISAEGEPVLLGGRGVSAQHWTGC